MSRLPEDAEPDPPEHWCTLSSRDIRAVISVGSRFHAFELARELDEGCMLEALFTGYPRFAASRFGLPPDRWHSIWTHEPLNRLAAQLYNRRVVSSRFDAALCQRFDRIVARRIRPGASIFIGWSNQCLESIHTARRFGMTTVVERGSAHISWQRRILLEEKERTGLPVAIPELRTVDRELEEYAVADYIAVPSSFAAATFTELGVPPERVLVNAYGVDTRRFAPLSASSSDRRVALRVLHVGAVSPQKGVHYLLEAVSGVRGAVLTLVGALAPGMCKLVTGSRVRVVGPVPAGKLPEHYAAADVFCLLSIQEGLALVLIQAMAMGLPVIATANTGAGDLITDGVEGFLVPSRDPAAVEERLHRLAADPALRVAMGQRARMRVAQGFSWRDYGERAKAHYARILADRATTPSGRAGGPDRGMVAPWTSPGFVDT